MVLISFYLFRIGGSSLGILDSSEDIAKLSSVIKLWFNGTNPYDPNGFRVEITGCLRDMWRLDTLRVTLIPAHWFVQIRDCIHDVINDKEVSSMLGAMDWVQYPAEFGNEAPSTRLSGTDGSYCSDAFHERIKLAIPYDYIMERDAFDVSKPSNAALARKWEDALEQKTFVNRLRELGWEIRYPLDFLGTPPNARFCEYVFSYIKDDKHSNIVTRIENGMRVEFVKCLNESSMYEDKCVRILFFGSHDTIKDAIKTKAGIDGKLVGCLRDKDGRFGTRSVATYNVLYGQNREVAEVFIEPTRLWQVDDLVTLKRKREDIEKE